MMAFYNSAEVGFLFVFFENALTNAFTDLTAGKKCGKCACSRLIQHVWNMYEFFPKKKKKILKFFFFFNKTCSP